MMAKVAAATRTDTAADVLTNRDSAAPDAVAEQQQRIRALAAERGAVILAHNYQLPEVQDCADFVGDSLALARQAAQTDADVIVFCGVHFMAETAAILSPEKTVLLPELAAGCSLADTAHVEGIREWRERHPDGIVVAYVNTSAAVKAEVDYCCTSSNAVAVVQSLPPDVPVLFLPDMFLGSYVERVTGRKLDVWMGECHVHAAMSPAELSELRAAHPDAELLVHPECGCTTPALYDLASQPGGPDKREFILSTSGMVQRARESTATEFLVATEVGILHQLQKANPGKTFLPVNRAAVCEFMKMITLDKLERALTEMIHPISVPPAVAERARQAVDRMLAIGA